MKYALLGNTGLAVSKFSLGAMTFGQGELVAGAMNNIDQKTADRMVAMALDAGVNLFDTADAYRAGESETMLGKALSGKRDKAIIVTKVGFRSGDGINRHGLSQRHVITSCEESLKRLNSDYVDFYLMHIPDPLTPFGETAAALDALVRRGLVRYAGYSNFPAWMAAKFIAVQRERGYQTLKAGQMYYSLAGRDIEHEVVPFMRDSGVGLIVWSPLASGFLTGKYAKDSPAPDGTRRKTFPFPPVEPESGYRILSRLKEVASARNVTPAQAAMAWVASKTHVGTALIGASSVKQLEENLAAANVALTDNEIARLDEVSAPASSYPALMLPMGTDPVVAKAIA